MSAPNAPTDGFETPIDPARTFDARLGLTMLDGDEGTDVLLRGRFAVVPRLLGEAGVVHSGAYASAAESLASWATIREVIAGGAAGQGLSNDTTVLADVTAGSVAFAARVLHRAEDRWTFLVEARDDTGALCAISRVIIAVRPLRR